MVLVHSPRHAPIGLELSQGVAIPPRPVQGDPEDLPDRARPRRDRLGPPGGLERLGFVALLEEDHGVLEGSQGAFGLTRPGRRTDLVLHPAGRASVGRHGPNLTRKRMRAPTKGAPIHDVRRRPTLPPRFQGSTIGAGGLNFRVRNGTGCFPSAIAAETAWECELRANPGPVNPIASASKSQVLGLLVPVGSTRCRAYTSGLSTSWSARGLTRFDPVGDLILGRASRLDAFS